MKKVRIKKSVVVALYMTSFLLLLGSIIYMNQINNISYDIEDDQTEEIQEEVVEPLPEENIPVVNTSTNIIRPYTDSEIAISKNYYDYKSDNENQKNAILFYENTYIQNSGICYGGKENFDVVAIAPGKVTNVKEDELLGKIVEITHVNNVVSIYQSLSEVNVKVDDEVSSGQLIAKSGTANIEKELGSHLHFELIVDGKNVNPEEFYDKDINNLQS